MTLKGMQELAEKQIAEILGSGYSWFENFVLQRLNVRSMSAVFTRDELKEIILNARLVGQDPRHPVPKLPTGWAELPFLFQLFDWKVELEGVTYTMTLVNSNLQRVGGPEPMHRENIPFHEFMQKQHQAQDAWNREMNRFAKKRY